MFFFPTPDSRLPTPEAISFAYHHEVGRAILDELRYFEPEFLSQLQKAILILDKNALQQITATIKSESPILFL